MISFAGNTNVPNTDYRSSMPLDIVQYMLFNNTENSSDTIASVYTVTLGPYSLSPDGNTPMYKGFNYEFAGISGTTPGVSIEYQISNFTSVSKLITASWVPFDTIATTGTGCSGYIDLTGKAGKYIWFRVNNYDNAACQVYDYAYINFKKNLVYQKNVY
jgi:hypothetical protein